MAIRRFNYTGRKRISLKDAKIYLKQDENKTIKFDAVLSLTDYDLPDEASVSVEAYRQTSWMRFPCGKVEDIQLPTEEHLLDFDSPEGVLFRVRVTSQDEPVGLLLAEADQIRPRLPEDDDENSISILPAKPDDSLGDQIFRVDFSDRPILLINSRIGEWRSIALDPVFIALVLPAAMREILTRILRIDGYSDTENLTEWRSQWLSFSLSLPGVTDLPVDEDEEDRMDDWIEEAVASFCRRFDMYRHFKQYWTEESSP